MDILRYIIKDILSLYPCIRDTLTNLARDRVYFTLFQDGFLTLSQNNIKLGQFDRFKFWKVHLDRSSIITKGEFL